MTWLPGKDEIYSYATEENLGGHGALSLPFFRRKYRWRALLLLPLLPVECLYLLALAVISGHPRRYVFLNRLAAGVIDATPGPQTIVLGSLAELPFALRRGALWIPVTPLYVALAWSEWSALGELPAGLRSMMRWFLLLLSPRLASDGWLLVQSDALPLARAVMAMARRIGARVCCVQHGIFHEQFEYAQVDGARSDLNIVRSSVDATIIRRSSPGTHILIEPALFVPVAPTRIASGLSVLFVGEAWHMCDARFDALYRARLREMQDGLRRRGIRVSFRPHPSERHRAWRYGLRGLDLGSKQRALERFNVFIGFASTLLAEAAAVGHTVIQLVFDGHESPVIARDASRPVLQVRTVDDLLHALSRIEQAAPRQGGTDPNDRTQALIRVIHALDRGDRAGVAVAR